MVQWGYLFEIMLQPDYHNCQDLSRITEEILVGAPKTERLRNLESTNGKDGGGELDLHHTLQSQHWRRRFFPCSF